MWIVHLNLFTFHQPPVGWGNLPLTRENRDTSSLEFKRKEYEKTSDDFEVFGDVSTEAVKRKADTMQALDTCH